MNVKINTKEKFTVISPDEAALPANMTGELIEVLRTRLSDPVPHVVLNMEQVTAIQPESCEMIARLQQEFYEQNVSMVICCLQPNVEQVFEDAGMLEVMNVTPTESEAWDIMHMEEIERELLDDENL